MIVQFWDYWVEVQVSKAKGCLYPYIFVIFQTLLSRNVHVWLFSTWFNQIHFSDMESKPDGGPAVSNSPSGSLTSQELAAIEDEEVLNKMVSKYL